MRLRKIIRLFRDGNVAVTGLRGRGKDMLFSNVVARRRLPYVSNVDYGGSHSPLELEKLAVGGNTYKDFLNGNLKPYKYPYEDGTDVYISDVGVYFPSQYCNELNRDYRQLPVFYALSRHLGACNVHFNVQNLNRAWDKLREQCDVYVQCDKCIYLWGLVLQRVTIYSSAESCMQRREPLVLPRVSLFAKNKAEIRMQREIAKESHRAQHGTIERGWLIYVNRGRYDTRAFKKLLENPYGVGRDTIVDTNSDKPAKSECK